MATCHVEIGKIRENSLGVDSHFTSACERCRDDSVRVRDTEPDRLWAGYGEFGTAVAVLRKPDVARLDCEISAKPAAQHCAADNKAVPIPRPVKPLRALAFRIAKMHFVLPNEVCIIDIFSCDAPEVKLTVWNSDGEGARWHRRSSAHGQCLRERGCARRDECNSVFRSNVRASSRLSAPSPARAPSCNGQRPVSRELSSEMKYWVHSRLPGWP